MILYKTTITPTSNFATTLKGDTLFGQICWAIRYQFSEDRLNKLLNNYETNPFLIVSDGFASGYLPKPNMPSLLLEEDGNLKKQNRKKIWLTLDELQNGNYKKAKTDIQVDNKDQTQSSVKTAINYRTNTTGNGFDPYSITEAYFSKKDIYFLIDDNFSLDELETSLNTVSQMGYGKKATIGKGRFTIGEFEEIKLNTTSKTFMTLSPSVLNGINAKNVYYEPFTRFGKHGAELSNTNPFKKPIILADTKAVINFKDKTNLEFVGKAIKGISTHNNTVHQGYSMVIPIKEIL
ncbi:hypothetical protein MLC52_09870 [Sulfurimonas sp. NW15]|uniref:type III-A CRISPR-associated RAMP protein Csm4 n=1 Tax=Sulfurimonas TaxID=202746 RepID=UPI00125EC81B|nr:hypothetical protein [Sulfurimonas hydrogeniphila]